MVLPGELGGNFADAIAAPCAVVGVRGVVFVLVVEVAEGVPGVDARTEIVQRGPAVEVPQGVASGGRGCRCGVVGRCRGGCPVEKESAGHKVSPSFAGHVDGGEAGVRPR